MGIAPNTSRSPAGLFGPLAERCGVSEQFPRRLWKKCRRQTGETRELDLSSEARSGRPSLLTPTKIAALRSVDKQNRSFTLRQVSDQLKDIGLDSGSETVSALTDLTRKISAVSGVVARSRWSRNTENI